MTLRTNVTYISLLSTQELTSLQDNTMVHTTKIRRGEIAPIIQDLDVVFDFEFLLLLLQHLTTHVFPFGTKILNTYGYV